MHSICQQIWKTQQWPQDWKRSVFIPVPKKGNAKECSNYRTIALNSYTGKVMLKILQARLQQCVSRELPDVQAGFRKGRGTRDQIDNICWIIKKAIEFQKNTFLLSPLSNLHHKSTFFIAHCCFGNERILLSSEFCKRIVHGTKNIVFLGWSTKGELTQDYV